jgi:hypothetical protein
MRCDRFTRTGRRLLPAAFAVLCAAACVAQTPESAATVIDMTGRVDVLRDTAAGALPWALNPGDAVMPRQIVRTGPDGWARMRVSDGSTFDIFPNSHVTFRVNPQNWKDLLDVMIGRVKVYIQKLNGLPNNNKVTTPTAVISVRGTIFDVQIEDDQGTTLVSVDEGEVGVRNQMRGGEVILHPGEAVRVFPNQPLAQKQIDRGQLAQRAMRVAEQIMDLLLRRQAGIPSGGGSAPGTVGSGDHGKGSDGSTTGTTTTTPAPAPPPPPPAPPE